MDRARLSVSPFPSFCVVPASAHRDHCVVEGENSGWWSRIFAAVRPSAWSTNKEVRVTPNKRLHRWTSHPTGAPIGNANARRHGMKSAGFFARRKAVAAMLRAARQAIREARPQAGPAGQSGDFAP
jgi:hypothetical protein